MKTPHECLGELPEGVTLEYLAENYPVYHIQHPRFQAKITLLGAHLFSWIPSHTPQDVLFLSPDAVFESGKAIRGGVPLCWPWFNDHASDSSKPAHGFARNHFWQIKHLEVSDEIVELRLSLDVSAIDVALSEGFENLSLEVIYRLGESLHMELITRNQGETSVSIEEAIHTYYRVGDVRSVQLKELRGSRYWDTVGEPTWRQQEEDLLVNGEVDRQYDIQETVDLVDPIFHRIIQIQKSGSRETVVWNPWVDKSKKLKDLPDQAYLHFLCVETANTRISPLTLKPNETHSMVCEVRVKPLSSDAATEEGSPGANS